MIKEKLLDVEIERLVAAYGAKAVREAAGRIGKLKRGRPSEPDYWGLKDTIEQDARDCLAGRDPRKIRSNRSIARNFVPIKRQHSKEATEERILKLLRKQRAVWIKVQAMLICENEFPFSRYFQVAREVEKIPQYRNAISTMINLRLGYLERYRERYGEPRPEMTIEQIELEACRPPPAPPSKTFAQLLWPRGDKIHEN